MITSSAVGILLNGSNSAFIRNSQVTGHGTAVAAMNDANADIGVASSGTGCDAAGPNIGNNSIHTNTNYNVSNISPSISIMAEGNWWNSNPPKASKFYGNVDRTPYLCSAPSPSAPAEDSEPARDDKSQSRIPTHYGLGASKPNPFNPTTTMTFDVPSPGGVVEISIFDVRGTRIRTLVQGYRGPGVHFATWTGESDKGDSVASGVYFVRMNARAFTQTRKLVLLK